MNADLGRIRLLLGDAVDGSHAPDEWLAIDRDYTAVRKNLLHSFKCAAVVAMAEHGKKNDVVCDVEVCVTGGQTIQYSRGGACAADGAGHW